MALLAVASCLPASVSAQAAQTNGDRPKRVLVLHVVRRDSPLFDDTFRTVLLEGLGDRLDYYSEYIDLNRLREEKYQTALRTYLRTRYVDDGVDLVIASGPSVVDFLNGDPTMLQGIPLVFTTRPGLTGGPNSTGIVSPVDFTGTLSAVLAAQPDTTQVFVVSGNAPFDRLYIDIFRAQRGAFMERVTFHEITGLSLPDLEARVRHLPERSILFFVSLTDDGTGRTFMPLDALDAIAAASNVPVYSWHEDALGHGIVGGRLHSSISDARTTAELALRVLHGEKADTIPVAIVDNYNYLFDWRQLQRWTISDARLPAGSIIRFHQLSFFEQNRKYVLAGGIIFLAQLALIGGLLIQRQRRRHAENALRHSETRNSAILRAIPDLMFVIDRNGTYVDYNARDSKTLFVPPESFLGRTVRDVMPSDLAETFMAALARTRESDEPVVVHYDLPVHGEVRHYEARLVPGGGHRVLSIVRDVTESRRAIELNRALAGRLLVSQEEERQRIARELHDDLSQRIALLNLEVDQIADEVPAHVHRVRLEKVSSQVGEIATDLSHLSHDLHPSRLQTLGLIESVRLLCNEISQQRHLNVRFSTLDLPTSVDPLVSLCLYRITQEALRNIAKHSGAHDATVHLSREGDEVHLQIVDSGIGFEPAQTDHQGLGLVSMRERVGILKGQLAIHAAPGSGTRIGVRVPLTPPSRDPRSVFE
jgi:PAS domain S-box-containing protein